MKTINRMLDLKKEDIMEEPPQINKLKNVSMEKIFMNNIKIEVLSRYSQIFLYMNRD